MDSGTGTMDSGTGTTHTWPSSNGEWSRDYYAEPIRSKRYKVYHLFYKSEQQKLNIIKIVKKLGYKNGVYITLRESNNCVYCGGGGYYGDIHLDPRTNQATTMKELLIDYRKYMEKKKEKVVRKPQKKISISNSFLTDKIKSDRPDITKGNNAR